MFYKKIHFVVFILYTLLTNSIKNNYLIKIFGKRRGKKIKFVCHFKNESSTISSLSIQLIVCQNISVNP